ncbi:unnamed protein product [Linum trigynum]|uniref:Uncharacterized protein n=1 Tax=Linum trigynum TaxID=586398 RepID=A0AAV2FLL0_9ROSI
MKVWGQVLGQNRERVRYGRWRIRFPGQAIQSLIGDQHQRLGLAIRIPSGRNASFPRLGIRSNVRGISPLHNQWKHGVLKILSQASNSPGEYDRKRSYRVYTSSTRDVGKEINFGELKQSFRKRK